MGTVRCLANGTFDEKRTVKFPSVATAAKGSASRASSSPTPSIGRRPNGFLGLSLNDRTISFLVILLDTTVSVG